LREFLADLRSVLMLAASVALNLYVSNIGRYD
jgi:hypothetical protein